MPTLVIIIIIIIIIIIKRVKSNQSIGLNILRLKRTRRRKLLT